jgi:Zn ribbon nucleic-acid-binding protein
MSCPACRSDDQMEFSAEMIVHLGGIKNLDNPGVRLFRKLLVCVACGFSTFTHSKAELASLTSTPTSIPPSERLAGRAE